MESEPRRCLWAHPWAQSVCACPALTGTKQQQRSPISCSGSTGRKALIHSGIRLRSLRIKVLNSLFSQPIPQPSQ